MTNLKYFLTVARDIVRQNCYRALHVPIPAVSIVDPSELPTPTTECAVSADGRRLVINRDFAASIKPSYIMQPQLWLALSHECRHIWQVRHADLFAAYRQSSELSLRDYNAQPAEIDAWAYAVVVVYDVFQIRPKLEERLGADVWKQIEARAEQIINGGLFNTAR